MASLGNANWYVFMFDHWPIERLLCWQSYLLRDGHDVWLVAMKSTKFFFFRIGIALIHLYMYSSVCVRNEYISTHKNDVNDCFRLAKFAFVCDKFHSIIVIHQQMIDSYSAATTTATENCVAKKVNSAPYTPCVLCDRVYCQRHRISYIKYVVDDVWMKNSNYDPRYKSTTVFILVAPSHRPHRPHSEMVWNVFILNFCWISDARRRWCAHTLNV